MSLLFDFSTTDTKYIILYPDENSGTGTGERVVDNVVSMKDVTFGAAREIAGGKAGMDDNSESRMLFFALLHSYVPILALYLYL